MSGSFRRIRYTTAFDDEQIRRHGMFDFVALVTSSLYSLSLTILSSRVVSTEVDSVK